MRQGYFSPSTQAPILQMTHFLPVTHRLAPPGRHQQLPQGAVGGSKGEGWGRRWQRGPGTQLQLWRGPALGSSRWASCPRGRDPAVPCRTHLWLHRLGGALNRKPTPVGMPLRVGRTAREPPSPSCVGWRSHPPQPGGSATSHERLGTQRQILCSSAALPPAFIPRGNSEGKPQGTPPAEGGVRRKTSGPAPWVPGGRSRRELCPDRPEERGRQLPAPSSRPPRCPGAAACAGSGATPAPAEPGAASPAPSFAAILEPLPVGHCRKR